MSTTACITCEGEGTFLTPAGTEMPCPDCEAGMWHDAPADPWPVDDADAEHKLDRAEDAYIARLVGER